MTHPSAKPRARAGLALLTGLALCLSAGAAQAQEQACTREASGVLGSGGPSGSGDAQRGQAIYDTGRRVDGSTVTAMREGMGPMPPENAACVNCHRASGMGQREGRTLVPPVAGHLLFAPMRRQTTPRQNPGISQQALRAYDRDAYTLNTLAHALRTGEDTARRPIGPVMPRYQLNDCDVADVAAHLHAMSQRPLHGVQQGTLHLASVVTPQAQDAIARTVTTTMRAWADKLSLTGWKVNWRLWTLTGPAQGWQQQLEAYWQAQPVFALVSGAGGVEWEPVAQFCDAQRLPCVFPSLESLPRQAATGRFSFYLSGGVAAEATLLARWALAPQERIQRVVHVTSPADAAGELAARVFDSQVSASAQRPRTGHIVARTETFQKTLASLSEGDTVALWLRDAEVTRLMASSAPPAGTGAVWLSASLAPPHRVTVPESWRGRVVWASLQSDSVRRNAGAALSAGPWARSLSLPDDLDVVALGDVHAATFYFTDTLARMREGLNAEYFTERLEDTVGLHPAGAGYFRLSLGPNQRVAAQSGHLLAYPSADAEVPAKVSPLLRAEFPPAIE